MNEVATPIPLQLRGDLLLEVVFVIQQMFVLQHSTGSDNRARVTVCKAAAGDVGSGACRFSRVPCPPVHATTMRHIRHVLR